MGTDPPFDSMSDEDIATLATAAGVDASAVRYIVRVTEQRMRERMVGSDHAE